MFQILSSKKRKYYEKSQIQLMSKKLSFVPVCKVKGKFPEKAQKTVFKLNDDSILTEFSSVSEEEQQMMRENFAGVVAQRNFC